MSNQSASQETKAEFRQSALAARKKLGAKERAKRSAEICASLSRLRDLEQAPIVAGFFPLEEEVDILPIAKETIIQRRILCLPRVVAKNKALAMHKITELEQETTTGYGGIREPCIDLPQIQLDEIALALVPSACIDRGGNRLGYGLGFYDITLAAMPDALLIAPIFHCQLVADSLPCMEPHDRPVDIIVTESEILDLRR